MIALTTSARTQLSKRQSGFASATKRTGRKSAAAKRTSTIARVVAKIYCGLGLLKKENIKEVHRADLIGQHIGETEAKTVLVRSKLPDAEYVVNPYTDCELGCLYCYATFTGRFVGEPMDNWGNYVYAKVNAVTIFSSELERLRRGEQAPSILLSSVSDPYQGAEKKYRLTRGILEALAHEPYPGVVSILTKSPLVLRDVDILRRSPRAEVGLTVTTTDDRLSRFVEVRAPLASRRLRTLAELHDAGVETYAFVGPLLPHFRYDPEALDELFGGLAKAGVSSVMVEQINL